MVVGAKRESTSTIGDIHDTLPDKAMPNTLNTEADKEPPTGKNALSVTDGAPPLSVISSSGASTTPRNIAIMNKVLNELITTNNEGDTSLSINLSEVQKLGNVGKQTLQSLNLFEQFQNLQD